jgi:hypothetical protein
MTEGIIGGILGDDDEKPEVRATEALAGGAFAAAVAARLCASDPEVAKKTAAFLDEQAHLVKVQAKHLDLGVRQDPSVAIVFYTIAAAGSVLSVWHLLRI